MGRQSNQLRMLFDGTPLNSHGTPHDFDMEDGDTIEVMIEQCGD
jgi:Ubiquitin-2 like Rad60 SUMO-like